MSAGFFAALQRSFGYRLAKMFPSGLVRWLDLTSDMSDQVVPVVVLTLAYPGPTIVACATYLPGIGIPTFTVVHNGPGDVTISYPAGIFRAATARPIASVTEGTATTAWAVATVRGVNNVRVFTASMPGAAPTDGGFVLQIFGQ